MRRRPRTHARLGPMIAMLAVVLVAVVVPAVRPAAAATVTARVRYDTITLGQHVGVIGATSPAAPHATVVVERRLTTSWLPRSTGTTDASGGFAVPITPSQTGIYTLRVRTASATSPVFYLRVLGPLAVDPGGLGTLRLGMSIAQATATHWIKGVVPSCEGCQLQAVFPAAVHAHAAFGDHRLGWIRLSAPGATIEGLRVGDPTARISTLYRPPTWHVEYHTGMSGTVYLADITRSGVPGISYEVTVNPYRVTSIITTTS